METEIKIPILDVLHFTGQQRHNQRLLKAKLLKKKKKDLPNIASLGGQITALSKVIDYCNTYLDYIEQERNLEKSKELLKRYEHQK